MVARASSYFGVQGPWYTVGCDAAKAETATHKHAAVAAADKESSAHNHADVAEQAMKQLRARHADAQKAILVALAASLEPQQKEFPGPTVLQEAGVTVRRKPLDATRVLIASLTVFNETNA